MKEKWKKSFVPLLRIIAFVLVFIFVFTYLSYMSKSPQTELGNITGIYGLPKNSIDVFYIGGSACFVYYAPLRAWEKYGIVSYDYATNTIQPEAYRYMIDEVLQMQKPELIILDARAFEYRDNPEVEKGPSDVSYRNILTGMRFGKNKIKFIQENVGTRLNANKLSYYFDLIKFHTTFQYSKDKKDMMFGKYRNKFNGFTFIPKHEKIEPIDFRTDEIEKLPDDTNGILIDLLEYIKQKELNCLFVVVPYAEEKTHKEKYNYVEKIVNQYGYQFIDANEYTHEMNFDFSTDLYNINHANIFGAEKYTDFLSEYMIQNYSIPDRRNENQYVFMNDYLEEWNDETVKTKKEIMKIIEEEEENVEE